jgi:signal transduction histidine kinase
VFQNLLGNALKYRRPEVAPAIGIRLQRCGGDWEIAVSDNGIGIDPAQLDRVFLVFQRLHSRSLYEGTGAGMALAQRIVQRHGGTIWAESEGEGRGTTFRFTLPRPRAAP